MSDALVITDEKLGYSYREYTTWPEDDRYELVKGVPNMMASPGHWHQIMAGRLFTQLSNFLDGKPCTPFIAPSDVRLFPKEDGSDDTVVQPDVFVVCDQAKLSDGKSCRGAPDFIIEVASESTWRRDILIKRNLYFKAGVKEYWVVAADQVYRYVLAEGGYRETVCPFDGQDLDLEVSTLDSCVLTLKGA